MLFGSVNVKLGLAWVLHSLPQAEKQSAFSPPATMRRLADGVVVQLEIAPPCAPLRGLMNRRKFLLTVPGDALPPRPAAALMLSRFH
jgi:hypothetical protein